MSTNAKQGWVTKEAAADYARSRQPDRFTRRAREEVIVRRWLQLLPAGSQILDCPCGTGRFVPTAEDMQLRYVGADFSLAMIGEAKKTIAPKQITRFACADAEKLPFRDKAVDCVILWRLMHHIRDPAIRQHMLREACRVTRRMVLVSFHHPLSFTFARRCVQRLFTGDWNIADITHWRLAREAAACGLEMVETRSFGKYRSINWFAYLTKVDQIRLSLAHEKIAER